VRDPTSKGRRPGAGVEAGRSPGRAGDAAWLSYCHTFERSWS